MILNVNKRNEKWKEEEKKKTILPSKTIFLARRKVLLFNILFKTP